MIHWVEKQTKLLTDPKFSSSQAQWQSIHETSKLGERVLGPEVMPHIFKGSIWKCEKGLMVFFQFTVEEAEVWTDMACPR